MHYIFNGKNFLIFDSLLEGNRTGAPCRAPELFHSRSLASLANTWHLLSSQATQLPTARGMGGASSAGSTMRSSSPGLCAE